MPEKQHKPTFYVVENLRNGSVAITMGDDADAWLENPAADSKLIRRFLGGKDEAGFLARILNPYKIASWTFDNECVRIFMLLPDVEDFWHWISRMEIIDLLPLEEMSKEQIQFGMAALEAASQRAEALGGYTRKRVIN